MSRRRTYNYAVALDDVTVRAKRMFDWRVTGLRRRYMRTKKTPLLGALLRRAERRAWKRADRLGRLTGANVKKLTSLAAVSNAARNAGLAVLIRDQISTSLFRRLTAVWRHHWLPLPAGPKK